MITAFNKQVPTTLAELVAPAHTALLIVDMQNDYIMPGGYTSKLSEKLGWDIAPMQRIVPYIKEVLTAARKAHVFVAHIQMTMLRDFLSDSPASLHMQSVLTGHIGGTLDSLPVRCVEGTWGCQIVDELAPLPGELVVRKHRYTAFMGTDLDLMLRSNGIKSTVVVGLATNACVMSTANHSLFLEYSPVLLRDCVASASPEMHEAALKIMAMYIDVVDSSQVLAIWNSR